MANKRETVVLYQRRRRKRKKKRKRRRIRRRRGRRLCCTYPTALPGGSILNQRNRSGVILLPLLLLSVPAGAVAALYAFLVIPFVLSCFMGCFTCGEYVCFCLSCVWARFCPALRAASLQWAAVQHTGFGFMPLGFLLSYCACTLEAFAYRQEKKTAPVTCFLWNRSSQ